MAASCGALRFLGRQSLLVASSSGLTFERVAMGRRRLERKGTISIPMSVPAVIALDFCSSFSTTAMASVVNAGLHMAALLVLPQLTRHGQGVDDDRSTKNLDFHDGL